MGADATIRANSDKIKIDKAGVAMPAAASTPAAPVASAASAPPAAAASQHLREAARDYVRRLDRAVNNLWHLGRNIVVGWSPRAEGVDVLAVPQYMLLSLTERHDELLARSHRLSPERLAEVARFFRVKPTPINLLPPKGMEAFVDEAIGSVVRRYSVTKSDHRAAILFDIVGFSLRSPLEQVTLLNSLAYSINVAHSMAMSRNLRIDLGRTTTGDGFYVWNRDDGISADLNLFYLMMLTLADNALARAQGGARTTPALRTSYHVGSHYEYYQAEGLNPAISGFIVGDLTIELARMIGKAMAGQVLIGNFTRPDAEGATSGGKGGMRTVSTPAFIARAQEQLDQLADIPLAGERVSAIKVYLTGARVSRDRFTIRKYRIADKHGLHRDVFNAKVNIYRGAADALYLGLENKELDRFDAEQGDYVPGMIAEDRPKSPRAGRVDMSKITRVEIHEFTYTATGVAPDASGFNLVYKPGARTPLSRYAITIDSSDGARGEYAVQWGGSPIALAQTRMLAPHLLGRDAMQRELIYDDFKRALRQYDHMGFGPIDICLWDLAGKAFGASIATLIGGFRTRLAAYASTLHGDRAGGLSSPQAYVEFAQRCLQIGYRGFKVHGWCAGNVAEEAATIRALGHAVGDRMALMVDPACELRTFADALAVGRACDDAGFFWYEDPFRDSGVSQYAHRKLRQMIRTPLLITEHVRGLEPKADFILAEATDLVRVDPEYDLGITGALKIAHLAEAFGLDAEVHASGPAHRLLMAGLRNTNFYELALVHPNCANPLAPVYASDYRDDLDSVGEDGCVPVPNGPGLGVTYDWEFIARHRTAHHVIA